MKGDFDVLELCRANASVLYPQYSPSSIQVTVGQTAGRTVLFYVAIIAMVVDVNTGVASPRLLETGPPRLTINGAVQAMLEDYLVKRVAKLVNEQASRVPRVEWKEGVSSYGYQFIWPQDAQLAAETASGSVPVVGNPAPPPYEDAA